MRRISQYLQRYALEAPLGAVALPARYQGAVVVPACDENAAFVAPWQQAAAASGARWLLVVVVNRHAWAERHVQAQNAALLRALRALGALSACAGLRAAHWVRVAGSLDILVLDRSTRPDRLLRPSGVAAARRAGFDAALALWYTGVLASPWLRGSDADAWPPVAALQGEPVALGSACIAPFWHRPDADVAANRAVALYELWLRYWRAGLRWAGSPYAYHSIGSCLSVHAEAYAAVRGVPRRRAGEDFHLLGKLAKVAPVLQVAGTPVSLSSRLSTRVVFGTGRAARSWLRRDATLQHVAFDAPAVWVRLATWLGALRDSAVAGSLAPVERALRDERLRHGLGDSARLCAQLQQLLDAAPDAARAEAQLMRRWDALQTLRFLHRLRALRGHAPVPWQHALRQAPGTANAALPAPRIETLDPWRRALLTLELAEPGVCGRC
ncbi:MAG: hypothetical protein ACPGUV_06320 [Polyangiales bacterium]